MAANEYYFATYWRVPGTAEQVYDLISKALDFSRWWPQDPRDW